MGYRCVLAAIALLALGTLPAVAASVDGRWVAKVENKKGTRDVVFNLKSDGDRVTGTVGMGKKGRGIAIADGRISGDEISFTTTAGGKKKQSGKLVWKGQVSGQELRLSRQREGGRRGQPLTAVRQ